MFYILIIPYVIKTISKKDVSYLTNPVNSTWDFLSIRHIRWHNTLSKYSYCIQYLTIGIVLLGTTTHALVRASNNEFGNGGGGGGHWRVTKLLKQ